MAFARKWQVWALVAVATFWACFGPTGMAAAAVVTVPGTSNPWLAGMLDGTDAGWNDVAPAQSPVLVTGIVLVPGGWVEVSATGEVKNGHGAGPLYPPDGMPDSWDWWHPAQLSKSGIVTPGNSLLGVFLDDNVPSGDAPPFLNFSSVEARDYLTLAPVLNQVFFMGDGMTSTGVQQSILVPAGATRLFLGTMDGMEWNNNEGAFVAEVKSSAIPEPSTLIVWSLLGASGVGIGWWRRRRRAA